MNCRLVDPDWRLAHDSYRAGTSDATELPAANMLDDFPGQPCSFKMRNASGTAAELTSCHVSARGPWQGSVARIACVQLGQ